MILAYDPVGSGCAVGFIGLFVLIFLFLILGGGGGKNNSAK